MIDFNWEVDSELRPEQSAVETIRYCIEQLVKDDTKSMTDNVVPFLTYEELIGALLQAQDLVEDNEMEIMWANGDFDK